MNLKALVLVIAGVSLAATSPADLIIDLNTKINAALPTTSSAPFAVLDFSTVSTGTVDLTITNNLIPAGYIAQMLFNTSSASTLTFTPTSTIKASSFKLNYDGGNNIKGGTFSIDMVFPTSNGKNDPPRLDGGDISTYTITGTGITANSFDVTNGNGWYAAADMRAYDGSGGGSDSVGANTATITSTPEPAPFLSLGLGTLGFVFLRRKKK